MPRPGLPVEGFAWPVVERRGDGFDFLGGPACEVGAFGEILTQQAIGVLIRPALPRLSTILGTASTAQNLGPLAALAVGGYIVLAGMWAGPVSGASMNPARSLGPDIVRGNFHQLWPYLTGPTLGMAAAVGAAFILRGPGGDPDAAKAAQGHTPRG